MKGPEKKSAEACDITLACTNVKKIFEIQSTSEDTLIKKIYGDFSG